MAMSLLAFLVGAAGLAAGTPAPDVSAQNQDGKIVRIAELKGRPVLVYFYPKDDTPGCTKEACSLRDSYGRYQALGAIVLGVSRQDAASHRAFREKYHLPFDLLVDEDGSFAKAFGVETMPIVGFHKRQSVLIGSDGKVLRFFESVDPATHSAEVLSALAEDKGAAGAGAPKAGQPEAPAQAK
jgi:peroxiredoxin Q/BCP